MGAGFISKWQKCSIENIKNEKSCLEVAREIIVKNINKSKLENNLTEQKEYINFYKNNLI